MPNYPVDSRVVKSMKPGDKLLLSALARDFPERKNGKIIGYPKYVTHCSIQDVFSNGVQATSCGAGNGASGAGCLTDTDEPSLVGVVRSIEESKDEEEWAVAHQTTNRRHYDRKSWRTDCVPLSGDFLQSLDEVAPEQQDL